VGLVNHRAIGRLVEEDESVRAAADAAQPSIVGMPEEAVDDALLLAGELVNALPACPVMDFDARRTAQAIDVVDLPDPADGELGAVRRERQRTDAPDGANALRG